MRLTGLAAGFHAVAHLPGRTSEDAVIRAAIRAARVRSVGLYGMSSYRNDHLSEPPQLVLGFGNLSQRAIQTGIAAIGDLLVPGPPESAGPPARSS